MNRLYYGDCLEVLPQYLRDESVDLVYLDPPFNSNVKYNLLFKDKSGERAQAQIEAFDDTWQWGPEVETAYQVMVTDLARGPKVATALSAIRQLLGTNDLLAYLVMMTPRMAELHRVLKPTGSLVLHCDPTASHYLKVILDAIFGPKNFRNEIIWRRTGSHTATRQFERLHDVLLFYGKTSSAYFKKIKRPYTAEHVKSRYRQTSKGWQFNTGGNVMSGPGASDGSSGQPWRGFDPTAKGRHWAVPGYLAEQMPEGFKDQPVPDQLEALYKAGLIEIKPGAEWPHPVKYLSKEDGQNVGDIWAYQPGTAGTLAGTPVGIDSDVQWLGPTDPEDYGYPTQKPLGLLRRVLRAACPPGGVVLDPFCGCGTTVLAAQELGLEWHGIDITFIAIDFVKDRLLDTFGNTLEGSFEITGIPKDNESADALFVRSAFEFERWAVALAGGRANQKQVADRGVDGRGYFRLDQPDQLGQVLMSVKGGDRVAPHMVNELGGVVSADPNAYLGLLIMRRRPTAGMQRAAREAGVWTDPSTGKVFPILQIVTVEELLAGHPPDLPDLIRPYSLTKMGKSNQPSLMSMLD